MGAAGHCIPEVQHFLCSKTVKEIRSLYKHNDGNVVMYFISSNTEAQHATKKCNKEQYR